MIPHNTPLKRINKQFIFWRKKCLAQRAGPAGERISKDRTCPAGPYQRAEVYRSSERMHPRIWIGCDTCYTTSLASSSFLLMLTGNCKLLPWLHKHMHALIPSCKVPTIPTQEFLVGLMPRLDRPDALYLYQVIIYVIGRTYMVCIVVRWVWAPSPIYESFRRWRSMICPSHVYICVN